MGYIYRCDACGERHDAFPPFAGEFTEQFLKTTGGDVAEHYNPGQKVTICPTCIREVVL